ncbi:unnamed protein product [Pedinophyceae sp. YPF-701]|nr:unnamed protein product [Pedinophyceae sp. YPF-701]
MIPSRARAKAAAEQKRAVEKSKEKEVPTLDEFLAKRDYAGAATLLEFERLGQARSEEETLEWLAYCHFHNGEHDKALKCYERLLQMPSVDTKQQEMLQIYIGCCLYYLGRYREAEETAMRGLKCPLRTRLLMHCANKAGEEATVMKYHKELTEATEDNLSLAAVHFMRGHYQQAVDLYKNLLLERKEYVAVNVYVAMCYSKLDYFDVSQDILGVYLSSNPDSVAAVNLRACNQLKLYDGPRAEAEYDVLRKRGAKLEDNPLTRHNVVVFRGGENGLKVLSQLGDVPPEAPLNLCIYHLRNGDVDEAAKIVKDIEPTQPTEYILKAVTHALLAQAHNGAVEHLRIAQQCFQLVGQSPSECDTIPGRQCMASTFFLLQQFEDVLVYLNSIQPYSDRDDAFNWNYGLAKAAVGEYGEASELLQKVKDEGMRREYCHRAWLARCHIMKGRPHLAWDLYQRIDTPDDAYNLLQLIANDCYRMGHFLFAAKAFDVLERLDPNPEYWEGKRGAVAGVCQMVAAGKERNEALREVVGLLQDPQRQEVEEMLDAIVPWATSLGVDVTA